MTDKNLKEIRDAVERIKKLRDTLPIGSPLHAVAFKIAAICGELEAELSDKKPK